MTLTDFLATRLDEDETTARAAIDDDRGEAGGFEDAFDRLTGRAGTPTDFVPRFGDAAARMITRYAVPARVLREVEAKRAIMAEHPLISAQDVWGRDIDGLACETCDVEPDMMLGGVEMVRSDGCPTLRHLAAIYQDHTDYDPAWRP